MPSDTLTPTDAPEDDLHSLLSKAFDEHEVTPDAAPEPAAETRQRGPDGKFVKAETTEAEPVAPDTPAPTEPRAEGETPPTEAVKEAPAHWKPEDKETFKALAPAAQDFLLRRHAEMEGDYTRKTQQHAGFVRDYGPVRDVLAPYDAQIRQAGFTPATLIKAWSDVETALMSGRGVTVVKDLVTNYKLDKAQVAAALGLPTGMGTEQPPPPDGQQPIQLPPELARELETLKNGQHQVTQFITQQQQAAQREAENRVNSTIAAFRDAKDGSGAPLHPHFDELEGDMTDLLRVAQNAGQQPTLDELYDKAVWANTSTRQKLLAAQSAASDAQRKAAEKKVADEARARAERARKAASSVSGTPGSAQSRMAPGPGERSLRDELSTAFDELADA